ncbi:hypothetical protein AKJ09_03960 [Labilithrix luteola]|uniref:Uncharacterized protein n=1 Tax=Labilithrix luteola TaxID=1391654 RepID=A0A0K1PVA6_9BACT|nr:hypothetical protein AKJ09_03960 [Labilithrix luteola]
MVRAPDGRSVSPDERRRPHVTRLTDGDSSTEGEIALLGALLRAC